MCFPSAARVTSTSVSEEKSPEKTDTRLDGWLFQRREKYWGPPLPPLPPPLLLAMLAAAAAAAAAAAEAFRRGMAVDLGGEREIHLLHLLDQQSKDIFLLISLLIPLPTSASVSLAVVFTIYRSI